MLVVGQIDLSHEVHVVQPFDVLVLDDWELLQFGLVGRQLELLGFEREVETFLQDFLKSLAVLVKLLIVETLN